MTYYNALIAKWATLFGSTDQKLVSVNAARAPWPRVDVSVSAVVGYLMLSGAYLPLSAFAQGAATGVAIHDNALTAAKMLTAMLTMPNAPAFNTSNATNYATIKGLMDAILAQETAAPGSTGFTQGVHDGLLALAETTVTWCKANGYPDAQNGGGGITAIDLDSAGGLT